LTIFEKRAGSAAGPFVITTAGGTYRFDDGVQVTVTDPHEINVLMGNSALQVAGSPPPVVHGVYLKDGILTDTVTGLPVAVATALPTLLDESFAADHSSAWVAHATGSLAGLVVADGVLSATGAADHDFHHGTVLAGDAKHVIEVNASADALIALYAKFVDNDNFIGFQYMAATGAISVVTNVGGVLTATGMISSVQTTGKFWIVVRVTGNRFQCEYFRDSPFSGPASPQQTATYTAAGGAIAAFGAGVAGHPGLRFSGFSGVAIIATTATIAEWVVVDALDRTGF
jgi:uncharacterized membrane protein YciS (DUF1049 family)